MSFQLRQSILLRLYAYVLTLCCIGDVAAQSIIPDYYREPGINPNRSYVNQSVAEHIDPFTGALQHHYVDLHIPGNGGFDLKVMRSYNSTSVDRLNPTTYESLAGLGWTMHFGRVLKGNDSYICTNSDSTGIADNPVLELPDGTRQILYFTGSVSPLLMTTQRWRAECYLGAGSLGLSVYSPDGTRYDMTQLVNVGRSGSSVYAWFTTKITDKNGNYANVSYAGAASPEITSISTNDGRSIAFSYFDSGTLARRIASVSGAGQTYGYAYELISGTTVAYQLKSVTRPDNLSWKYEYNGFLNDQPGNYILRQVTYPQGGTVSYQYGFVYFDVQSNPNYRSTVVSSKTRSASNGSAGGTWGFVYLPGGLPGVLDTTKVTLPSGTTEIYRHIGPIYATFGSVWSVGLLESKTINGLQTETYTWGKQKISTESFSRPGVFSFKVDAYEVNAPILKEKKVTRDGATYTTTYDDFDSYGNPGKITESGTSGGNRTTNLTYYINADKWIIKQVKNEVHAGGSITRDFDTNGNMTMINRDGVTTTHTYDAQGNISSTTFPRSLTRYYSNYSRGIPKNETQPEGITIAREVSDAGNVTSETNGEGFRTTFDYDGLNRIKYISYPTGTAVNISYGTNTKTATRGSLTENTSYDGFGQVTGITLGGITRTYAHDAIGRTTFTSDPSSPSGTSYEYDELNRIKKVTNSDGSSSAISYGPGNKTAVDERGNATTYSYRAYGNPDQQFLMGISAAESSASIAIQRNGHDLPTQVTQGGLSRVYDYYSNYYLKSVTNPETGTTTYGRDDAGNMTSRSVGNSGTTVYDYDNQNRLRQVTYPGVTPSVTNSYYKTHKLHSSTSSTGSRNFGYDANGNLTSEELVIDGITFSATYGYNGLDQLNSITYPKSGSVITYAPDSLGRPTQVSGYASSVSYWPSGQVKRIDYANGTSTEYGQNTRLWPSSFNTSKGSSTYISTTYGYDWVGNVKSISDPDASFNRTLEYDNINRVKSISGPWGFGSISYDGVGNITSQTLGAWSLYYNYHFNLNRLMDISGSKKVNYDYDANGNITSAGDTTYVYDGAPNLRCINCGDLANKIEYSYDATNHRSIVVKGGVKTYEMYGANGNQLIEFTPSQNNKLVQYIYLGGKRIAQRISH